MDPALIAKKKEYEARKARAKALRLRLTCTICGEKAKLNCPCETTQYCSVACQKVDWRERGHREACKKIRSERARAEAPTPPPSLPVYGPAPRSQADEIRARIKAEHEAARARREANPEPEPASERFGSRCPICMEEWDVNELTAIQICCCRRICDSCDDKINGKTCPLCRSPFLETSTNALAVLRRHVENDLPEAINYLANCYRDGNLDVVTSSKKAVKIYRRAVELGNVSAMTNLGAAYEHGDGVKLDRKKAAQLYRMAADRGFAKAQLNLAGLLYSTDIKEAHRLARLAAAQGYAEAECFLGNEYERGNGDLERDLGEAKRWYLLAAACRHPSRGRDFAQKKLARRFA